MVQAESVSLGWLMLELKNSKQILSASQVKLGLAIKTRILLASIASDYMQVRELMLSKAIFPAFQMLSRITYRSRSARLPSPPALRLLIKPTCLRNLRKSTFCPVYLFLSKPTCCSRQIIFKMVLLS